jgi:CelD/BcsL family acetyltransferase involved in cellulose biosynthesis
VGANIPPKVFNPPVHGDWAEEVLAELMVQLFERDCCDVLSLGPMSEMHKPLKAWEQVCQANGGVAGRLRSSQGVHSVFWLPGSIEAYFECLSKNERKNRRKYELRTLKKEYDARVEVLSAPEQVEPEFENFVRQHTEHWNAQGKSGHFGAWPRATGFNRALVKAQGALGRTRFVRILANNRVVASEYTFAFGDSYFWELPARAVGEEWERFSLGPTGIVQMIDAAIREGRKRLEGGLAHYDYKVRLNAKEYATKSLRMVANRMGSRIRAAIFGMLRLCVLVCYHRLWYKRVSPRLPAAFRRPMWMLWLRLDF